MPLEMTVQRLREIVANLHFANDGDAHERQYWPLVMARFPNCERFWRDLVVPLNLVPLSDHHFGPISQDRTGRILFSKRFARKIA
jgi:hypothetical protein